MSRDSAPWVLGIGASNHNGAACLLRGDELVVAVQEERLIRRKRAWLPGGAVSFAVRYCLETAGIRADELSLVSCCSLMGPRGPLYDVRANPDLAPGVPVRYLSHHLGHAVGAFATSGFDEALVLVVDGFGSNVQDLSPEELSAVVTERRGEETLSVYHASREGFVPVEKHLGTFLEVTSSVDLERFRGMPRFGSLGGLYSAVGRQLFSDVLEGPGKVMGMAPHGVADTPVSDFFDIVDGRFVFHDTVPRRFTHDERWPARQVEYRNLAASAQAALEDGLLRLVRRLRASTSCDALCYAGGVALNSVANERLFTESGFKDLYVMPAAEDSGTAIGAAYHGLWQLTGRRSTRRLGHDSTGRTYSAEDCDTALRTVPAVVSRRLPRLVPEVADLLAEGKMLGWFQGGSELGPRSLGQRSILCDPRPRDMKDTLNARVKFREGFRPFAPVILAEKVREWFDVDTASTDSPFMLRVWRFREEQRERVPAVAHVNGTGRVQTVTREHTPLLHALLTAFHERTGVPILLNTSFNIAGEPIVETPEDALWGLLSTGLEGCVLLDRFVSKHEALHSLLDLEVVVLGERIAPLSSESAEDTLDLRPLLKEPLGFGLDASGRNLEDARRMLGSGQQGGAFKVQTPWGAAVQLVSSELSTLVAQVQRGMSGWKLLERVSREDSSMDEQKLTRMLGTLRRARVLQFGPGV
ncbi:carbamoyltransferase C-terminal domain-containing protein [Myxococcus sp. AB025B]|uniref:carbamoyltransferase family protein n=1 Tax=Myxococcus sp. AB025B TaxID=2562794 RepID=UPI001144736A|nr:carbamoyltransferase C-terminal domain-containing protein [Myxococcus sp. AB025B]